jgi:4'-phosphopantetheinyl transferase
MGMRLKIIPERALTQGFGAAERIWLPVDEVHIWSVDLRLGGAAVCTCWDLLAPEERWVALGYRFAKDRREFVVTRALLRQILARYTGRATADLCFDFNSSGKPVLRGAQSLHFSVSHSRDLALLAIAQSQVGIDVEYSRTIAFRQGVIEQCLARPERSHLQALPPKARAAALHRCWTQKEAVLKALGAGLLYPPRHLNALADGGRSHVLSALGRRWLVRQVDAPVGYAAAVAIEQPNCRVKWRQWRVRAWAASPGLEVSTSPQAEKLARRRVRALPALNR